MEEDVANASLKNGKTGSQCCHFFIGEMIPCFLLIRGPHPGRIKSGNLPVDRTGLVVGTWKIARAHEKLVSDFSARKMKGFLEQSDPVILSHRMVMV